ncbi:MAG: stage II sporulation protein M [Deltaproteobacteria bacterium]|jgi:uncharacterized membrane protein SpoIIM required for sporulation|nr:stage II sporulation protein M [Deltaproteobacteria bacterium]
MTDPASNGPAAGGPALGGPPSGEVKLRSANFRKAREKSWARLDEIVSRLDSRGFKSLTAQEAMELPLLYQSAVSSLALARHLFLDQSLVDYLENLATRGHLAVYGPRQSLWAVLGDLFNRDLPRATRALKIPLLIAFLAFLSGVASGFFQVLDQPLAFYDLIPEAIAGFRGPETSSQALKDVIFAPFSGFEKSFVDFAGYLFRHNSLVAFLAFALGFALGVPTIVILYDNGVAMGAFLAIHWEKGLTLDFLGWVAIHGTTELGAIILAGAAGLGVAERILFPGERTRRENLAQEGHVAVAAMVGAVFMLLVAGLIEGGLRQLIANTFLRLFVGIGTLSLWAYYFAFFGREEKE